MKPFWVQCHNHWIIWLFFVIYWSNDYLHTVVAERRWAEMEGRLMPERRDACSKHSNAQLSTVWAFFLKQKTNQTLGVVTFPSPSLPVIPILFLDGNVFSITLKGWRKLKKSLYFTSLLVTVMPIFLLRSWISLETDGPVCGVIYWRLNPDSS